MQAVAGDNERRDLMVNVSGPLGDTVRGKFSYGFSEYDGHTRNNHPVGDADVPGPSTSGNVGGWEDTTWAASLEWDITEKVMVRASWHHSDLERELQPYYVLGGLNSAANGFISEAMIDMNCNMATTSNIGAPGDVTGNSIWCGELPLQPDPDLRTQEGINVDPRGIGAVAESDIAIIQPGLGGPRIRSTWSIPSVTRIIVPTPTVARARKTTWQRFPC